MKNTKLEICEKCWGTGHVHGGDENSTWNKSCKDCTMNWLQQPAEGDA